MPGSQKGDDSSKDVPPALTKEEKKLEMLKIRRSVATKQIDRINEFNSKITQDTFLTEFKVRLEALETSFKAFQALQAKVEEADPNEALDSSDLRGVYEEMYYTIRSSFMYHMQNRKLTQIPSEKVVSVQTKQSTQIKLPELKVPLFSGEVTEWLSFHETFNSLIHTNPNLSYVSKFHYLISSLSGQAAKTVQSLEITEANYEVAMNLLIENYDNKKLIATEHIKKIMMYSPLRKSSSSGIRHLLQEINSHLRALSTLGRPVAHWDDLLIQIILPKLDPETLSKWKDEGPADRMPSFQELSKFLTKRSHTLTEDISQASTITHSKTSKNSRSKSFAIVREGSTAERSSCIYCNKTGHLIHRCYQFMNLPIIQKQQFVASNNLCQNCLKPNSSTHNCQATKCRKCNNSHHTLLHDNHQNSSSSPTTSAACPTTNNFNGYSTQSFHIHSLALHSADDKGDSTNTILATAIIHVMDKHNSPVPCRVLLDSASHVYGSIEVRLPFKTDPKCLGRSCELTHRRFLSLERRLQKNPELADQYISFMREYIKLSHMELTSKPDSNTPHYFIPHHCITKPGSSSTKLRVVFDASAKSTNGISLNEILHVGPVVQSDLFSLVIKFRSHPYVFTADVTKMYRQFKLNENDRQFHLILWRENPREAIKFYRLCTVTYGTALASYLATKSLQYLAEMENVNFPLGANILRNHFYVDDILTGAESVEKLEVLKMEVKSILATAGLELKKWCSNSPEILHDISLEEREPLCQIKEHDVVKTLGLLWDPKIDAFLYTVNNQENKRITKRTVLSDIARLYDPLGLINPVIVLAKIFMQTLWKEDFNWDEALPQSHHQSWITFRNQLPDRQIEN